jgi:type 1 glutamine amidotransferase
MIRNLAVVVSFALFALAAAPALAADGPKVLIITGDHGHNWKETTPYLKALLEQAGMNVSVTETPAKDLTADNLSKYDVFLLNYKDTKGGTAETNWTDENKKAFDDAVRGGKGLFVYHHASSAFINKDDPWSKQFETIIAGGWRSQGFHGKRHEYDVTVKEVDHPITKGLAGTYPHSNDELYQNSLIPEGAQVLATAWSEPSKDPKNTGKHEPMVWVTTYGKGRVCNNALGHDVDAMQKSPIFQVLLVRGVEWAARGDAKAQPPAELKKKAATAAAPAAPAAK